jgi:hypothetical protein
MDHASPHSPETSTHADVDLWSHVRRVLEDLLACANEVLGPHLRHDGFAIRPPPVTAAGAWCEVVIGRSILRLECAPVPAPASSEEPVLHSVFGPCTPISRIHFWRLQERRRRLESVLAADPTSRLWATTDPPFGPAPLDDRATLEAFLWTLLSDPP